MYMYVYIYTYIYIMIYVLYNFVYIYNIYIYIFEYLVGQAKPSIYLTHEDHHLHLHSCCAQEKTGTSGRVYSRFSNPPKSWLAKIRDSHKFPSIYGLWWKFTLTTLPETNSKFAPENQSFEGEFPFGMAYFQGWTVSFRERKSISISLRSPTTRLCCKWVDSLFSLHLNSPQTKCSNT